MEPRQAQLIGAVARHPVPAVGVQLAELRLALPALLHRVRTAGVEVAAGRRGRRVGDVALDRRLRLLIRIGERDRSEQRLRVGVQRRSTTAKPYPGCSGCSLSTPAGATSTTRPRYITAIRSLTYCTTVRSWAMKT